MEAIHGWSNVPSHLQSASIAIGNFDGVHRGHHAVLKAAKEAATHLNAPMGVMIFEPYPRSYFQPNKPVFRLTTLDEKLRLFSEHDCAFAAIIPFGKPVAEMSADEFVKRVLVDGYHVAHVTAGFNFYFGKGRGGNPGLLRDLGGVHNFGVTIVEPTGGAGEIFSSTRVRELLAEGDVAAAADILGRWWRISGVVESGAGRGSGLGFPTANIRLAAGVALKHGIYAVRVHHDGEITQGASYLGTRPTFDAGLPVLETFLFDFDGNLYNKTIEIEFIAFVREDAKFKSAEALSEQMAADSAKARQLLSEVGDTP